MTKKLISTKAHGIIDYLWVGGLFLLPQLARADSNVNRLLTLSGLSTLLYSLLTRYELGVAKLIPMRLHLAFDLVQSIVLLIAALWTGKSPRWRVLLLSLSVVALTITANTQETGPKKSRIRQLLQTVQR